MKHQPKDVPLNLLLLGCCALTVIGCGPPPLPWPDTPLYSQAHIVAAEIAEREEALTQIIGHYAHFDVVAYEEELRGDPMRTFITSYGFTDISLDGNLLVQDDRFCHAEHQINREGMTSSLSDTATQAIRPPPQEITVTQQGLRWLIHRPVSPTLIGANGDPSQPLPNDRNLIDFNDPDNDGKPGITVQIQVGDYIRGEVYIARREMFENLLELKADGSLRGTVRDFSEQVVAGASSFIFDSNANPTQADDVGLNPVILIPIPEDIDTCDELMEQRHSLLPEAPSFPS
jgi:hypothetical protein